MGHVEGNSAIDQVCFTSDKSVCLDNIQFLAVNTAEDIDRDEFSGIAGLAPNSHV